MKAQNEALHAKLDAQMDRFDKLQATLDAIRLPRAHTKYFPVRDIATAIVGQESKEELGLDEDVEMMEVLPPNGFLAPMPQ